MIEATAWCHRCHREFTVFVSDSDFKEGICYDECECGKSGQFGLVIKKGDSSKRPIYAPGNAQQQVQPDCADKPLAG